MTTKTREASVRTEADTATRERILLEASRLFRHHGYAATTLREVADAAGIKAGSIYYHFESKEQILGEVLDKGIQAVADAVRQRVESLPKDATA
ncbi:MAG TPA: helix-turn-helix domain-containing protein, partial [Burkholderiaceae bacterium]|nr:helix-turn-helix domain-containing protein [Burkholderiaceae bacterium]